MKNPFQSFFMGGYECADHVNRHGDRVNLLQETAHDRMVREDYQMLSLTGITTVREGICWSKVEKQPFVYDFSEVTSRIRTAEETGIQQIWDMCHFGYPDDLMPTHPRFVQRFAELCRNFATTFRDTTNRTLIVTPINEISFLSWLSGDKEGTVPFLKNMGWEIKLQLCKASIEGIRAIREADPESRIMLVEPMIHIHPPEGISYLEEVDNYNESQFQAMDIIGGRLNPELGGEESFLDILGFNYYFNNQWEHHGQPYHWPHWVHKHIPFSTLLNNAYRRYNRPVVLSETGHFGSGRADWMRDITRDCLQSMEMGTELWGICIYPLIDRPDWDNLAHYHNSGLFDMDYNTKERIINQSYLEALLECEQQVKQYLISKENINA